MKLLLSITLIFGLGFSSLAQKYVLKDHRPDSNANKLVVYDSLPFLVDTFFKTLAKENVETIKLFVPDIRYLRSTYDTMDVDYNLQMVVSRQQIIQRGLQRDYKKILKKSKKWRLSLKRLEVVDVAYEYGKQDKYSYCYVTMNCKKKKKKYVVKFLAMELLDHWFLADEFYLEWVE